MLKEDGNTRTIWAVRHCEPIKPDVSICLGRKNDPTLSPAGTAHAQELGERLACHAPSNIYCSPLLRSRQTAACIGDYLVVDDLTEQDYGSWDGLDWDSIRAHYPDLYAMREHDNSLVPPDAETCEAAALRYNRALVSTQGDCVAVVHKGALSALLCQLLDVPLTRVWSLSVPYGGLVLLTERNGCLDALPQTEDIRSLYERYGTPERVILHCQAVANLARDIVRALIRCGVPLSERLVYSAALLHDIARTQKNHPACGAQILTQEGYPYLGAIVAKHHDANQRVNPLDEAAVVFFADKLVSETNRVDLYERFARSKPACKTDEARAKHASLLDAAERISDEIYRITGTRF